MNTVAGPEAGAGGPGRGSALSHKLRALHAKRELLQRTEVSCLTLLLTWRCPAECDHCVFDSGPKRKEVMDSRFAARVIEAAATAQSPPPGISFSGGEPFLEYAMMLELMGRAKELGCASEVVTSCAWAAGAGRTMAKLTALRDAGLRTVCVSWDRFHSPFIKAHKVAEVIAAAVALGLRVVINTALDPLDKRPRSDYLARTLALPPDTLSACSINVMNVVPVGRARTNVAEFHYPEGNGKGACPMSTEILTVTPDGLLYPCCGSVVGERSANSSLYAFDDVTEKSVEDLRAMFRALKNDLFFRLLQVVGPAGLLEELRARHPEVEIRRRYNSDCDACLEINGNEAVGPALQALLEEYGAELRGVSPGSTAWT